MSLASVPENAQKCVVPITHSARPPYAGIDPRDVEVLRSRAIPPHIAAARESRTITADEARDYGFPPIAGLLIPSHNTQGEVERYQLRPHTPPIDPESGKPRKYLWPTGSRQSIDVPPGCLEDLRNVEAPLIITEAPLKADALVSGLEAAGLSGIAVAAVAGVYGWRSADMPLSDHGDIPLKRREGERIRYRRRVYLAFDSDASTNPNVARARWEYAHYLRRRGARVKYLEVPAAADGGKQGIDDALAAGCDLSELIRTAYPAPDIMPVIDPDADPDPEISELDQLRAENTALRAHVSILTQTLVTPHVNAKTKALVIRIAAEARAKASKGEADPNGRVMLSTAEISNDWRRATPKGETTPAINHTDGSVPIMKRGTVLTAARAARDLGLIDFEERKVKREHANGNAYQDTEILITPPVSIAEALRPVATYRPAEITPRPYRKQDPCPHCGEVHARTVIKQTMCGTEEDPGCGAILSETIVTLPIPPANDPEATPEQRAALEEITAARPVTSTQNVEVQEVDMFPPSPAGSNELSPGNVEVTTAAPPAGDMGTSTLSVQVPGSDRCKCGAPIPAGRRWTCSPECDGTPRRLEVAS